MSASETFDKIMEKATPLLEKLSFIFGNKTTLTLIVQAKDQPGCLVLSPSDQPISSLIESLREAEDMINKNEQQHS